MKIENENLTSNSERKIATVAFKKTRRTRGALIVKARGSIYGSSRTQRAKVKVKL